MIVRGIHSNSPPNDVGIIAVVVLVLRLCVGRRRELGTGADKATNVVVSLVAGVGEGVIDAVFVNAAILNMIKR